MKRNANTLPRFILGGSLVGLMVVTPSAFAQTTATDDLDVKATLSAAFSISCDTALNFGEIVVPIGSESASVVIADDGSRTVNGVTTKTGDSPSQGICNIAGGTANASIGITYLDNSDSDVDEITLAEGSTNKPDTALTNLKVDSFVPSEDSDLTDPLDSDGKGTVNIGATLQIPAGLSADNMGDYSGVVRVQVEDNV